MIGWRFLGRFWLSSSWPFYSGRSGVCLGSDTTPSPAPVRIGGGEARAVDRISGSPDQDAGSTSRGRGIDDLAGGLGRFDGLGSGHHLAVHGAAVRGDRVKFPSFDFLYLLAVLSPWILSVILKLWMGDWNL